MTTGAMLIDQINLNHLRIFESVFRTRSMTAAAQELHLTQSGVSQHMKSLEDVLEFKLFDRVNQKLIPTSEGKELYAKCSKSLYSIEESLSQIKGVERELNGKISIGMPVEFGNNVILPLLSEFSRKNPFVRCEIRLEFASVINEALLKGDLDFGFVDAYQMDRRITTEKVYEEVHHLCIHPDLVAKYPTQKKTKKYYESLPYIAYQPGEPVLRAWFNHHLGTRSLSLDVRSVVMDVQAVASLIQNKVGAGVLPHHLLSKIQDEGVRLQKFKGASESMKNAISIAYLKERTLSPAANAAMAYFKGELVDQHPVKGLTTGKRSQKKKRPSNLEVV